MSNFAKELSEKDGYEFLRSALREEQKGLEHDLDRAIATVPHNGVLGSIGEQCWIKMLKKYLPRRYEVNSAFVIDSEGHTSEQIDVVVYDPQYTPTLLGQESHFYVPAEAVYAVFDAKQKINKELLIETAKKAESVRRLKRTSVPIVHSDGVRPAKQHFEVIAGILARNVDWSEGLGKTFCEVINAKDFIDMRFLNCGCGLSHGSFDFYDGKNNLVVGPKDCGLAYFLFRLLNKLQSLGTVPAIDWNSYAKVIANIIVSKSIADAA
jgi:hypothetical protein